MKNPWEEIPLADYEGHMKLDSVMQLQAMNTLMRGQLHAYPVSTVMILGLAGGNGLEHISRGSFSKVYGVDINPAYLEAAARRYPDLRDILSCICLDLTGSLEKLPPADLVIANLLVEYIGYPSFQRVLRQAGPAYVSCVIQINITDAWVSDSPYLHVFDGLDAIHHQIDPRSLKEALRPLRYLPINTLEHMLPNGKKLLQIDFQRAARS